MTEIIKHTLCDICSPGPHCGVDVCVEGGRAVKISGTKDFPTNKGKLCIKGAAGLEYVYSENRIKSPMKKNADGSFSEITWDEAIKCVCENLNRVKAKYGPESVVFMCGYPKWFRPWLHRLSYSFGSPNYITESSACHNGEVICQKILFGTEVRPDFKGMPDVVIAFGVNPLASLFPVAEQLKKYKEQGGRLVEIDCRFTPTAKKLADIYLRPKCGSDGYLANTIANILIENNKIDFDFIRKRVHGFEEYKAMVKKYNVEAAAKITGLSKEEIFNLAELIGNAEKPVIISSTGVTHHQNGFQNYRAIMSLNVLKGSVFKPGTLMPSKDTFAHLGAGFSTKEKEYYLEKTPGNIEKRIGYGQFPLWDYFKNEAQGMALIERCESKEPYPLKAAFAMGVNHMMYPEGKRLLSAFDEMDFVVSTDVFWTETAKHSDIVLPACTSYERSEVKCYGGGWVYYSNPAIEPLYKSRDDVSIIADVAKGLGLKDELLEKGYDAAVKKMFEDVNVDLDDCKALDRPVKLEIGKPDDMFRLVETITGKIELKSELIEKIGKEKGLNPLPEFDMNLWTGKNVVGENFCADGFASDRGLVACENKFPFTLIAGGRVSQLLHSRLHKIPSLRKLRPYPLAEINPKDAERLSIKDGDDVFLTSTVGKIKLKACINDVSGVGEINIYHGYEEADANSLIPVDHRDPYTGFPGYKEMAVGIEKA